MHDSLETEKLIQIIERKRQQLIYLLRNSPNNPLIKELNTEITFLRDTILPVLLMKTTVFYSELAKFVTQSFYKLEQISEEKRKFTTGILLYYEFKKLQQNELPILAIDSNIYLHDTDYYFSPTIQGKPSQHIIMQDNMGVIKHPERKKCVFVNPYNNE